jgi:integrase
MLSFAILPDAYPEKLEHCQKILALPFKRAISRKVEYLEHEEIEAVLAAIDRTNDDGCRDYILLATMFNTGARVQEILDLRLGDLQLVKPYQTSVLPKQS